MGIETWYIWIIAAVLLFIVEIFVPTFFATCIAMGCIAAGIFSALDFGIKVQIVSFSIGILASFFGVRPFMLKYAHRKSEHVKTNVDALVGKMGRVSVAIDNAQNQGRVIVEGDDWKAEAENNEILSIGKKIEVLKVNSTILIVKIVTKN